MGKEIARPEGGCCDGGSHTETARNRDVHPPAFVDHGVDKEPEIDSSQKELPDDQVLAGEGGDGADIPRRHGGGLV